MYDENLITVVLIFSVCYMKNFSRPADFGRKPPALGKKGGGFYELIDRWDDHEQRIDNE